MNFLSKFVIMLTFFKIPFFLWGPLVNVKSSKSIYIHIGWVGTGYYLDFQPTKKLTIHSGHLGIVTCFGFFLDFF